MNEWLPENPYPNPKGIYEQTAHEAFYEGCQQTARKVVEHIQKHVKDNNGYLDMFWFIRFCKEVGRDG